MKLAYSLKEACNELSIGTTKLHELLNFQKLKVFKIGRKTLITGNSLHAVIGREELNVAPKPSNFRRERWGFSRANLWQLTKLIYVIGKALSDNYCSCVLGCLQ